ncbi:angiotensin-converting enzyme-related protein-like, partial [Convolutriloba macropyga]|uniref:angiotensin-converting enzyme-related protein-like n=1 Tax=Convolutriloba macropyga TaxID=536237 RepID=UPI003F526E74
MPEWYQLHHWEFSTARNYLNLKNPLPQNGEKEVILKIYRLFVGSTLYLAKQRRPDTTFTEMSGEEETTEQSLFKNITEEKIEYFEMVFVLTKRYCYDRLDPVTQRKVKLKADTSIIVNDEGDRKRVKDLEKQFLGTYRSAKVNMSVTVNFTNLTYQTDLFGYMNKEIKVGEPLWNATWHQFRDKYAPELREPMIEYRNLLNKWAKISGHKSAAHAWVQMFEVDMHEYEGIINQIAADLKNLYQKLHAYIRFKLREKYPELIEEKGLIPSHLTREMHGQVFLNLLDIALPYEGVEVDLKPKLEEKYGKNFTKIVELAEQFFQSFGFPELPASFYENSKFHKSDWPAGKAQCFPTTHFFYIPRDDIRIMMCGEPTTKDFYTIHHEIGHVYYLMAYANMTHIFYD